MTGKRSQKHCHQTYGFMVKMEMDSEKNPFKMLGTKNERKKRRFPSNREREA